MTMHNGVDLDRRGPRLENIMDELRSAHRQTAEENAKDARDLADDLKASGKTATQSIVTAIGAILELAKDNEGSLIAAHVAFKNGLEALIKYTSAKQGVPEKLLRQMVSAGLAA